MSESPYAGLPTDQWCAKTEELVNAHPLTRAEIVEAVLQAWHDIFDSRLGPKQFQIGKDIYPDPQIMSFLLHELIPLEFASRHPDRWRRDQSGQDKDLVSMEDDRFSIEIKASSSKAGIFGNRSYAQPTTTDKKSKSGYYLAVNFDKFDRASDGLPALRKIRFGWLDHSDWKGQSAASGQAATPSPDAKKYKLLTLYPQVE
jgi:hypothetical protein